MVNSAQSMLDWLVAARRNCPARISREDDLPLA